MNSKLFFSHRTVNLTIIKKSLAYLQRQHGTNINFVLIEVKKKIEKFDRFLIVKIVIFNIFKCNKWQNKKLLLKIIKI